MKYRITRIVPEQYRVRGMEPFVDPVVYETLPDEGFISACVDDCHFVMIEEVPDSIPTTNLSDTKSE